MMVFLMTYILLDSIDACSSSIHLVSDGRAIVCVHPLQQTPLESTKVSVDLGVNTKDNGICLQAGIMQHVVTAVHLVQSARIMWRLFYMQCRDCVTSVVWHTSQPDPVLYLWPTHILFLFMGTFWRAIVLTLLLSRVHKRSFVLLVL